MPISTDRSYNYYSIRRAILPDGTERLWKLQLRPANDVMPRNRHPYDDDIPVVQIEMPDSFIDSIVPEESKLERQMGLQTPPTIKITCMPEEGDEEFADMVAGQGDYEDNNFWRPIPDVDMDYVLPITNTWIIWYSDDDGETWSCWFAGIQLPNESTKYGKSTLENTTTVQRIEITVVHATYWILTQVPYSIWGKMMRYWGEDSALQWRSQYILYDTVFKETVPKKNGFMQSGALTEEHIVNVTENWGIGSGDRPDKDVAYLAQYGGIFGALRIIVHNGLRAHRFYSPNDHPFVSTPCVEVSGYPPCNFFKQNYNTNGGLGDAITLSDLWAVAGVKQEDGDFLFGLLVDTLKSNGCGFDGETCADALQNLAKGYGSKAVYRIADEVYGEIQEPVFTLTMRALRESLEDVKTLDAIEDFSNDWEFERCADGIIARGATFNINVEPDNESKFSVYGSGNQNREDIAAKMQMHNLPTIRKWEGWSNPDATIIQKSWRASGFTLRRLWYLDQPDGISSGKPDHKVPIRVHEYCEFNDGEKVWDNSNGNPFSPQERHEATLKADMLGMQRKSGMPNAIARGLSAIFSRPGVGKLTARVHVSKLGFNDVGSRVDITIPAEFTRLQGGKFYLEAIHPDKDLNMCESVFLFIPND